MSPPLFVPSTSTVRFPSLPPAILPLTLAAMSSRLPNTSTSHPKAIFQFRAARLSISMFCGAYSSFPLLLMCFHCSGHFAVSILSLQGKFWLLGHLWHVLTFLLAFSAVLAFLSTLGMSLHMVDLSTWFPEPFSSPRHHIFVPIGEFDTFGFFGVLLISSAVFSAVLASF